MPEHRNPLETANTETPAPFELTQKEQEAVDCAACFAVHGREIESADVIACRGQNPNTLRPILAGLVAKTALKVVSPEGVRRKRYEPTGAGMLSASKDLNPWECPIATGEKELADMTELQQKALDCASCVKGKGHEITVGTIVSGCGGLHETVDYSMRALVKKGYLTQSERIRGWPVIYDFTDAGLEKVRVTVDKECLLAEATMPANEASVLDCIKCQVAKGLAPERRRVQDCTGLGRRALLGAVTSLMDQGLIRQDDEFEKVGLRTTGKQRPLRLNDASMSAHNPECAAEDLDITRVFNRLSEDKKRMLGCIACVAGRQSMLPGVTRNIVAECAGVPAQSALAFVSQLITEGYVNELRGFAMNKRSVRFLAPSDTGNQLIARGRDDLSVYHECATDFSQYNTAPIHTTNSVIKCVGCIWTQQIAAGQEPQATASMVGRCVGVDASHLVMDVMPKLAESGYFTATGRSPIRFRPSKKMIIPLGYSATCKQEIFKTNYDDFFTELPPGIFEPQYEDESLKRFEEYVNKLKGDNAIAQMNEFGANPFLQRHLFPLLTAEEEAYLGMIIQKSPDESLVEAAQLKMLLSNLRMAIWIARDRKFEVAATSFEDMTQAAIMGISKAARRFDPLYGFKFSTYAYKWMLQSMQYEAARITGIKRPVFTKIPMVLWAIHRLRIETGKSPAIPEIAMLTGYKVKEVENVITAYASLRSVSLDDDNGGDARSGYDSTGTESSGIADAIYDDFFRRAEDFLDDQERDILKNVILNEAMSIIEFADAKGAKRDEVAKSHATVLAKLQHPYFGFGAMLEPKLFDWQQSAECFLSEDDRVLTQNGKSLTSDVRELCGECEVNAQCRTFAERQKPSSGIWAGQSASHYRSQ
jgi:RNA polymerase sigma factor (sigma-70 family)